MMEYPQYKKVLFCTDFSDNADYAFGFAFGVAKRDGSLLYVLHVRDDSAYLAYLEGAGEGSYPEITEAMKETAQKELEKNFQEHYAKDIKNVSYEIVTRSGRAYHETLKFVEENDVDLIVIGTHGRTGLKHTFFGSVAEMIIRHSPVPVFVIPPKEKIYFTKPDDETV